MSNGSSPFLDTPRYGINYTRDSSITPQSPTKKTHNDLLKTLNKLNYEIENLKNENSILKINSENSSIEFEKLINDEQNKNIDLQSNLDFLFNQNKELKSKLENLNEVTDSNLTLNSRELSILRTSDSELKFENNRLKHEQNDKLKKQSKKIEELSELFDQQQSLNEKLNNALVCRSEEINELNLKNNDLISENQELKFKISSNQSNQSEASLSSINFLQKELTDALNLLSTYETTISKQKDEISRSVSAKQSFEMMREENKSLIKKIASFEETKNQLNATEIENLRLKNQLKEFKVFFDDNVNKPGEIMNAYSLMRNENLVLQDKLVSLKNELVLKESEVERLNISMENLTVEIQTIQDSNRAKDESIAKLDRQKKLSLREIELLRNQLKSFDDLDQSLAEHDNNTINSNEQYLRNLEKLIDDYRTENLNLQTQLNSKSQEYNIGDKRMKIDGISMSANSEKLLSLESKLKENEQINIQLESKLKSYKNKIDDLNDLLRENEKLLNKEEEYKVLMLKNNPATSDQLVKQSMLDALKRENNDLISKLSDMPSNDMEVIPRSLLDRNILEQKQLENQIYELNKKIKRLREIYIKRSKEFIESINKFLGYRIEFLPNNKIKIFPQFYGHNSGNEKNHLLIDSDKQSLKINYDETSEDLKFKQVCDNLVKFWIVEKNQIPCFLSALNLELYENYKKGI